MWDREHLAADTSAGTWVADALARSASGPPVLRWIMPDTFGAYARILHRATDIDGRPVRWREVALASRRVMHPLVQWDALLPRIAGPRVGAPDPDTRRALVEVLRQHTRTPERISFAVWEGNTALDEIRAAAPVLRAGPLGYFLVRDTIDAAGEDLHGITPALWWPEDRAWCVCSNGDLNVTYVGGTPGCLAAVFDDPDLEAFPVRPGDRISSDSDTVNRIAR